MIASRFSAVSVLSKNFIRSVASRSYSIKAKMEKHEVVPDVIPVAPAEVAKVTFDSGVSCEEGNVLTPTQVKDAPKVEWNADADSYYLLCKTDPDAPSRQEPKYREWHHWIVGNIKGGDVSTGETLSAYIGAGPPPGTGLHRYVYLIYKQNGKIDFDEPRLTNTSAADRANFSIAKLAEKYNLGAPVAGNLYQAEYDDYVPLLYKQLGE